MSGMECQLIENPVNWQLIKISSVILYEYMDKLYGYISSPKHVTDMKPSKCFMLLAVIIPTSLVLSPFHQPVSDVTCTLKPSFLDSGCFHIICTVFSFKILNLKSDGGITVERGGESSYFQETVPKAVFMRRAYRFMDEIPTEKFIVGQGLKAT